MKKLTHILVGFLVLSSFGPVFAQEDINEEKIWSLEECLRYGIKNHPKIIMADSDIKLQEAALLNTKASFDPKISSSMNIGNSKTGRDGQKTSFHSNSSQSESVSFSKKLYDSGRYSLQKKQSKEALEAAKRDRETALIDLAANIKTMFFKAQQAQCMLQVKLDTLDGYEKHLKKVESFVEVGTHAPYDITKAQVNVANARVELISARSSLKEALVNVANAMGIDGSIHIAPYELQDLTELDENLKTEYLKMALERPDVKSAEAKLKSAQYKIKEAKSSLKPTINTSAGYSWNQTHTPQNHSWNVGLGVSWNIYDGRSTKASIDSAKTSYERSKASYNNLKLTINKEVENGIYEIIDAYQRCKANEVLVQQASESLNLAEGRYDAGLGSPLEITDARVDYSKAQSNLIKAYFDCFIAQTALDKILGQMPTECNLELAVEPMNEAVLEIKDNNNLDIEFESEMKNNGGCK